MNEYEFLAINEDEWEIQKNKKEREILEEINSTISQVFKNYETNLTVFEKAALIEKLSNEVLEIVLAEKEESYDNGIGYGREN